MQIERFHCDRPAAERYAISIDARPIDVVLCKWNPSRGWLVHRLRSCIATTATDDHRRLFYAQHLCSDRMLWSKSIREISHDLLLLWHWCIHTNSHANRVLVSLRPMLPMAPDAILPYNQNCIVALSPLKSKTVYDSSRSYKWGNRATLVFRLVRANLAFPWVCVVVAIRTWSVVSTQMCHGTVMVPNTPPNCWRSSDWSLNGWPRYAKSLANAAVLRDARRATIELPIVLHLVELRVVNLKIN